VPAPTTPSDQRTILQYLVNKSDIATYKEVEPMPLGEFRRPEEADTPTTGTPPSEFATPGGQSPETVKGGSADEADTVPTWSRDETSDILARINTTLTVDGDSVYEADTRPTWSREATSDILSRINTYKYVGTVDLEKLDLNERQGHEGSSDTQGLNEQPRDVTLLQDNTARFDWRVDLKDNSYKYDSLVEPVEHTGRGGDIRPPHGT